MTIDQLRDLAARVLELRSWLLDLEGGQETVESALTSTVADVCILQAQRLELGQ